MFPPQSKQSKYKNRPKVEKSKQLHICLLQSGFQLQL